MTTRLLPALLAVLLASTAACVEAPAEGVAEPAALSWSDTSSRASFSLWKSSDSQFRFRLVDADGVILLTSEGYTARTGALTGLVSVLANGGDLARYQLRTSATGGHFVLRAGNGEIIATGTNQGSLDEAEAAALAARDAIAGYRATWDAATGRRFALHLDNGGKHYWNLHAGNGEIVLRSQRYDSEAAALNGMFSVVDHGTAAARYQVLPANGGGYYLNLTASNGQVIGTSEVYATKSNAERARDAIIALLPTIVLL
jgi:uncharacterized protein YegP (UPF0339 family)